jgi:excinuclease UvrABC nuclease subunit
MRLLSSEELLQRKEMLFARSLVGVYFLFSHEEIVYVGKSIDILARIRTHAGKGPEWGLSGFAFVECKPDQLSNLEQRYIYKYRPKFNKIGVPVE